MMDAGGLDDRRAQRVAGFGLLLQAGVFGALVALSVWFKSHTLAAVARFTLLGVPIWFVLWLIFKQLRRVGAEELETAELRRAQEAGAGDALFELDDEALLIEQNRLRWLVRWMLPSATVAVAVLILAGHFVAWGWRPDQAFSSDTFHSTQEPTLVMWFVVAAGFACFLYARYVIALSRIPNWRMLRAGASCMAGNALVCLGMVLALMASDSVTWAEPLLAYILRLAMLLLGLELTGNFILDFYRPRTPGVVARPSFDSRLLGLLSEPGGIAKSIADAVNYQFGFEVSSTWFYQLLQRWLFPIVVVAFLAVIALTGVVVVDADEQVVIERFGRPPGAVVEVLSPGLHLKWPFPVDLVRRAPVKRIDEIVVGEATEKEEEHQRHRAILWTEAHDFVPELMLLVAAPKSRAETAEAEPASSASVAVSLLMVSMPIEYRIKDLKKFLYTYDEPVKLLEGVAHQILSDFAAGVDLDALMGPERAAFNARLGELIQARLDALDTGIEIVFAGLRGAHPPAKSEVANAFHAVVTAQTKRAATIEAAEGEVRRVLTSAAGTEGRARSLDRAIQERDRLQTAGADPSAIHSADERVTDLLVGNPVRGIAPPSGEAAAIVADAKASASDQVTRAINKVRAFATEVAAYEAAPDLYKRRKLLEVYAKIGDVRKFLIVGDPAGVQVEYQTAQEAGLDRVLSEGVESEKKKKGN